MKKVLGIDIGGTSIKCALVDEEGHISNRFVLSDKSFKTQDEAADKLCKLINDNVGPEIEEIGIGCPGSIDSDHGICLYSNNLRWKDFPIAQIVAERCHKKTRMINDANAAMLGEANFGVAKGRKNVVLLTLGTGVGSGLFLNGQLYEGYLGGGAEIGHMVIEVDGRQCTCGRKGCLEAYASVTALIKQTQQAMKKDPKSKMWKQVNGDLSFVNGQTPFEGMKRGDPSAIRVLHDYFHYLGEGIINCLSVFRPEIVVLGGGLSGQKEALTNPLTDYVKEQKGGFGGDYFPTCPIVVSSLGNSAGIIGAACQFLFTEQIAK